MRRQTAVAVLSSAAFASALAGSTTAAAQAAPPSATSTVAVVHVDSPSAVDLEHDDGSKWVVVCTSPCDKALPASGEYRINGAGVRASSAFGIEPGSKRTLSVEPGSSGAHTGALVVTIVGGVGLLPAVGVSVLVLGATIVGVIFGCPISEAFSKGSYVPCVGDFASYFVPGYSSPAVWGPAAAGGALLVAGIVWLVASPRTNVTQVAALPAAPRATSWRAPQWDEPHVFPLPAATPIVTLRF
jgi:hypothetical protein